MMKKQTRETILAVIELSEANGIDLEIVSGDLNWEGGVVEKYEGEKTATAIMQRLTRERCNGDRWALVQASGGYRGTNY